MIRSLCALAALATLAPFAGAQSVIYATNFDDSTGWTTSGSCWNVDDEPAAFVPGPAHSAPASLNCNNAFGFAENCFDQAIDSPAIDLSTATFGASLSFWCAFELEEDFCDIEARHVQVSNDGFQTLLLDDCYQWADCGGLNNSPWHQHQLPLDPAWGTVQVRFWFDCYDLLWGGSYNGWFVDDLLVSSDCPPSVPYCTAKVNSQGCTPTIFTTGDPSFTGAGFAFRVQAANVLNQHPGILIWSLASAANPFSGGTLCVAPPVNRTPGQASGGTSGGSDCTGSYSFQFTPSFLAANSLTPGTAVFTQYWSRDTGFSAPNNVGLTSGMRFAVCD